MTGGGGFIGSNLVTKLLQSGHRVNVLDLLESPSCLEHANLNWIQGDLLDRNAVSQSLIGVEAVIHLAAQTSVPASIRNPEGTHRINVTGTEILMKECVKLGVKKILLASSAAVYGDCEDLPLIEDSAGKLLSPYAESKWKNEHQLLEFRESGLDGIALRFFNVYGTHTDRTKSANGVISAFVNKIMNGDTIQIHGDGTQTRDFIHVNDISRAIISLLQYQEPFIKHAVNICTESQTSLLDLISVIENEMKNLQLSSKVNPPIFNKAVIGDIRHSLGSYSTLSTMIGWSPEWTLNKGIKQLITDLEGSA